MFLLQSSSTVERRRRSLSSFLSESFLHERCLLFHVVFDISLVCFKVTQMMKLCLCLRLHLNSFHVLDFICCHTRRDGSSCECFS